MDINQALRSSVADLDTINPWLGLSRFIGLGIVFLSLITLAWSRNNLVILVMITVIAGFVYAFWLICTHDTTHYTLTGWRWFEIIFPRLMAWPMFWPYGTYTELHILHHAWNGNDLRDPERVQWTVEEYQQANPLLRWYVRHQMMIDLFILGGIGLILKTFVNGWRLRCNRPHLMRQMTLDLGGIIVIHSTLLGVVLYYDVLRRYLLFWLILERMIGIIVQMRDHLEHYGRWGKKESYLLTQLYATRNLKVNQLTQWLMGGLPYHSIHHGFPNLPFYQLPEAFNRIQKVLKDYDYDSLEFGEGYLQETFFLSQNPTLIMLDTQEKMTNNQLIYSIMDNEQY